MTQLGGALARMEEPEIAKLYCLPHESLGATELAMTCPGLLS